MLHGLEKLEDVLQQDGALVRDVQVRNNLAAALLSLEDAAMVGKGAGAELAFLHDVADGTDEFCSMVLSKLPKEGKERFEEARAVPTDALIRRTYSEMMKELAASAFMPPGDNRGLLGELFGRFFKGLYKLDVGYYETDSPGEVLFSLRGTRVPRTPCAKPGLDRSETMHNMEVISRAVSSRPTTDGEIALVLLELEKSLTGRCHERAQNWIAEMRRVLLVRQALTAIKARAHCLTRSTLAE